MVYITLPILLTKKAFDVTLYFNYREPLKKKLLYERAQGYCFFFSDLLKAVDVTSNTISDLQS